jgi:hypothetical protein
MVNRMNTRRMSIKPRNVVPTLLARNVAVMLTATPAMAVETTGTPGSALPAKAQ